MGLAALDAIVHGELSKGSLQRFVIALRERGLTPGGINMYGVRVERASTSALSQ